MPHGAVADAFDGPCAELGVELRVLLAAGVAAFASGDGDAGFVEGGFGVGVEGLGDELVDGERGWCGRVGGGGGEREEEEGESETREHGRLDRMS